MKKLVYSFAAASLFAAGTASAQTWQPIKDAENIREPRVAVANNGKLYAAGTISGKTASAVLFEIDGNTAKKVYEPDYKNPHFDISLDVDPNSVPYLAYREVDVLKVQRLEGKKMVDVSAEAPGPKGTSYFRLALDKKGTPYVFYLHNAKFYVKRLNGSQWEQLLEIPQLGDYKTAFNSKNELHLTFKNNKAVKKLVDGALVDVGPAYTKMMNEHFGIYFDNKDQLYVTFGSSENYPKPSGICKVAKLVDVKQADGKMAKDWQFLPNPTDGGELKDKAGELPTLTWDNNNTLYFACSFRSINTNTVQKFDGTKWEVAQSGIDGEYLKQYGGIKQLVFSAKNNLLLMSRPFVCAKL